jgi:hypothetical protein
VKKNAMECRPTTWRGRAGCFLANDVVEVTHLTGGGQIPEFRYRDLPESNPFWIPRWELREPTEFDAVRDSGRYGPAEVGRLLSAIAGHSLCLGNFGMPSDEEIRAGGVLHGEAGVLPWKWRLVEHDDSAEIRLGVRVSQASLTFARTVSLGRGEAVVRVRETVGNPLAVDQWIQWQQHVAFSASFLAPNHSSVALAGKRGITDPGGYEGHELLAKEREFIWPHAPGVEGGACDLRVPFLREGSGFVAGIELDKRREYGFIGAVNRISSIAFGYLFLREDFPWATIWEENLARDSPPWNAGEQVRALEFGVSPLPAGRAEMIRCGSLFNTPTVARVPAKGELRANYCIFLARLPHDSQDVAEVTCAEDAVLLLSPKGAQIAEVPAEGVRNLLRGQRATRD